MDYKMYMELVNKYYKNDNREINYQNRVIIPFLEDILGEGYDVVDVSQLTKQWKNIERNKFAGFYTPDLLVAKNWKLRKGEKDDVEYLLIIEVKTPTANDRKHAENEINEYMQKVPSVILTDCLTWEFYTKRDDKRMEDINLEQESMEKMKFKKVRERKINEHNDSVKVCKRNITNNIRWKDEEKWTELCNQIKRCLE